MSEKSVNYEASVRRLDEIVKRLEQGDAQLEEAMKLFQEGTELIRLCTKLLDGAELEIVKLMKGENGEPIETEFAHGLDE